MPHCIAISTGPSLGSYVKLMRSCIAKRDKARTPKQRHEWQKHVDKYIQIVARLKDDATATP